MIIHTKIQLFYYDYRYNDDKIITMMIYFSRSKNILFHLDGQNNLTAYVLTVLQINVDIVCKQNNETCYTCWYLSQILMEKYLVINRTIQSIVLNKNDI